MKPCASLLPLVTALLLGSSLALAGRDAPKPLAQHPGNIFIEGEPVVVPVPASGTWRMFDYDDKALGTFGSTNGRVQVSSSSVGWYRLRRDVRSNEWVSFAVLPKQSQATSTNSPIAIDVAMSWFYPSNKMADVASLCALAGVNWVRDRLTWGEMEPAEGRFAGTTRYDAAARAQTAAGLRVLQVNHSSAKWAVSDRTRFPEDLRRVHAFYREMARRWAGQVLAFEPWNEADIAGFGGHTGAEMASLQKAAYLGLKSGNPDVTACLNVWAGHRRVQLDDFAANEATAYFDTYNLHHYEPLERYPALYADHRAIAGGKPLWVTEFSLPVKWSGEVSLKELSDSDLRAQSERLVKAFAASLAEGTDVSFYFMLPHYVEGQTQFGILRPDLTPRPAFVSLAAVARLLGDKKCRGALSSSNAALHVFAFDGRDSELLLGWADQRATLPDNVKVQASWDHLGRKRANASGAAAFNAHPIFVQVPKGTLATLSLVPPPTAPRFEPGPPSSIVLQPLMAHTNLVLPRSAWRLGSNEDITIAAYNFGSVEQRVSLTSEPPPGWTLKHPGTLKLAPGARQQVRIAVELGNSPIRSVETVRFFAGQGTNAAMLSLRVMPERSAHQVLRAWPIEGADSASAWQRMISGDGAMTVTSTNGEIVIEAEPRGNDRWFYPRFPLTGSNAAPKEAQGLMFELRVMDGQATFRAICDEKNGSGYVLDLMTQPSGSAPFTAVAQFEDATYGFGWSKPDPNQRFDAQDAVVLKIGGNTKASRVKFAIRNLRWVAF